MRNLLAALAVLAASCFAVACAERPDIDLGEGEGEGEGEEAGEGESEGFPALPEILHLEGSASGQDGGLVANCTFFADIGALQAPADGSVGFDGVILGGEVFRRVEPESGEGNGAEFQALVGGPVTLRRTADGDVLRFVGDQTGAPRFWRAIEALTTSSPATASWSDAWRCEPIDVDEPGFVDTTAIVEGTWTMAALP